MERAFDRVLLIRHLALCVGAATAYLLRSELQVGYTVLWIVGVSAVLNFSAYLFGTRPALARAWEVASPVIGIGGWAALISVTNGVSSPFIAGLWLEIVLSAMAMAPVGVAMVTVGAVTALWGQQLYVGVEGHTFALVLQTAFLYGMGAVTYLVTRRWLGVQSELAEQQAQLDRRLEGLEQALEDERTLGRVGESAARLAHSLKNTVHSLRGFVSLIEPRLERGGTGEAALAGLRATIDDLETLARVTLDSDGASESRTPAAPLGEGRGAGADVRRAIAELGRAHPGVEWDLRSDGESPNLSIASDDFVEVLQIVMKNAIEAMAGGGKISVATAVSDAAFCVRVSDQGTGFSEEMQAHLFSPGHTTKPGGSGYGLFLARRVLEEHGGQLSVESAAGDGAVVALAIPVVASPSPEEA